jgi:hypothetical protein
MARIAYILLCHKDPDGVIAQARRLTAAGDCVAIHFDARAAGADFRKIRTELQANPSVAFADRRVRCGWGEWSLVAATLAAVRAGEAAFPDASHFYLISGDCMPIKTAEHIRAQLDEDDADLIECLDFFDSDWIRTGLKEERLVYRHFANERTQRRLFYAGLALQRRLGLRRALPQGLRMMIGSQWWCLRRRTVEAVLAFCRARPDVVRFFRTTWIPDESFFQTLVRHLVPAAEIRSRTPTFLMFTDYGMPATFYNDHHDLLLGQEHFFARKISPEARELKARLGDLYGQTGVRFAISGEGRRLHGFLTSRGREGRRFAPRFWEAGASMGQERRLMIIACKKWHVARRLAAAIRAATGVPTLDYIFNEEEASLPHLGGIETTLAKRGRHRRTLLRLLFDHFGSDRMVICLDTASYDIITDLYGDRADVRLLEVQCQFSDDYLAGHARRVGLAGAGAGAATVAALLPTVRFDVRFESDRIRDADLAHAYRMAQGSSAEENAAALARFLSIPPEAAHAIAATPHLFDD